MCWTTQGSHQDHIKQICSKPVRTATVEDSVEPATHLTLKNMFGGSVIKDTREQQFGQTETVELVESEWSLGKSGQDPEAGTDAGSMEERVLLPGSSVSFF